MRAVDFFITTGTGAVRCPLYIYLATPTHSHTDGVIYRNKQKDFWLLFVYHKLFVYTIHTNRNSLRIYIFLFFQKDPLILYIIFYSGRICSRVRSANRRSLLLFIGYAMVADPPHIVHLAFE